MLRLLLLSLCCVVYGLTGPNTTGKICQWGCWDEEDEACHPGLNAAGLKREDAFFLFKLACWLETKQPCDCKRPRVPFLNDSIDEVETSVLYLKSTRVGTPMIRGAIALAQMAQQHNCVEDSDGGFRILHSGHWH